jgi:SAM-dependent methyltransferase
MASPDPHSNPPWSLLASCWEELFPLRPARLDLALHLAPAGSRTLDAGCATGSLVRALASRGRLAEGLDLEPAFLEVARTKARAEGLDLPWHLAGLSDLVHAVGQGGFQLISCLGQTLPHLLEEAQWLDFFLQAKTLLRTGGRLAVQAVNDGSLPPGSTVELPVLEASRGRLERRRVMVSPDLARFETVFHPLQGEPVRSQVHHLRMGPAGAAALLEKAGLEPGAPLADESGRPFQDGAPGWLLVATRL